MAPVQASHLLLKLHILLDQFTHAATSVASPARKWQWVGSAANQKLFSHQPYYAEEQEWVSSGQKNSWCLTALAVWDSFLEGAAARDLTLEKDCLK